jgi:hypothetical protein
MAGALEKLSEEHEQREVHDHLTHDCPWYRHVGQGGRDHPDIRCQVAGEGALVKFTPHTPEASTVPKPTVPPGGPGLFHIKGRELPPYVQHLWHHLAPKYGKEKAYGMAVGIVKKWAAGVNPGGRHPTKTHPDVRAVAQKNVAEWEKDKADAHAQSARHEDKVAATVVALVAKASSGHAPFPGQAETPLPPMPKGPVAGVMFVAHRIDDLLRDFAHANERLRAARQGKALRGYHLIHVNNHLGHALDEAHALAESLRTSYPAESRELEALTKTIGLAKAVSPDAKVATFAHLLQTILYHAAHAKRHAMLMTGPSPDAVWKFNWDHAATHSEGAIEHSFKLANHVTDNYPEIAKWFKELEQAEDPKNPYTGLTAATAPGARPMVTAPTGGGYSQYGLNQHPAQAIAPSPPLPPDVKIPTPAEVRAVISQVPTGGDEMLAATARKFLDQAAGKLERDSPLDALAMLRSAQAAVLAAHKKDKGDLLPSAYTANIFTQVPPAAQSSATSAMKTGLDRQLAWRRVEVTVAALTDRIRKKFFHGVFNGPSQLGRFSSEADMTALDRVLALAITTGKDVSEPTTSDVSGRTPLIQPLENLLNIADPDAARQLAALPALDKARVTAYLESARGMLATNRAGAAQFALRAATLAREAGARDLARHILHHVRALGDMGNTTHDGAGVMSSEGKTVRPSDNRQTTADAGNTRFTAVDRLVLAAGASSSAGSTAGKSAGRPKAGGVLHTSTPPPGEPGPRPRPSGHPDAHQLHVTHLEHLHRLHELHLAHIAHMHHLAAERFGGG